jgi:hypothetical protein
MRLVLSWFLSVQLYYTSFVSDGFFAAFSSLVTSPTLDLSDSRMVFKVDCIIVFLCADFDDRFVCSGSVDDLAAIGPGSVWCLRYQARSTDFHC